jgi:hypothetical protein
MTSQIWGLLRLWTVLRRKRMNAKKHSFVNLTRAFSALLSSPLLSNFKTKKGGSDVFVWRFYGRFLSINRASTIKPTMIRTARPAIAGTKYMSATDVGVGVGETVVAADTTTAAVSPDEP